MDEKLVHYPDAETHIQYLLTGLADNLSERVEDFLHDLNVILTKKQFNVLLSHIYYGWPIKEIALKEGITEEAVRQRLKNALIKAKDHWGKETLNKTIEEKKKRLRAPR